MDSIAYEDAMAKTTTAKQELADAMGAFAALTAGIAAYDDFSYQDISLEGLQERQKSLQDTYDALSEIDPADLTDDQAAELEAVTQELAAVTDVLDSPEATDLADKTEAAAIAEDEAEAAAKLVTDEALTQALLDAANKNRVAEYGEDNYVDDQMLDWAKDILGVGPDAYGKIDQIRDATEQTSG
jgi:hypothetical protein